MVIKAVLCALAVTLVATGAAAAQEPPPVAPPAAPPVSAPPPVQPPAQEVPPAVATPATVRALDDETFQRRRKQISMMEGVLVGAVREAAQDIANKMQSPETGPFLLSGALGARGFHLDGYGVFFHVEIPGVQPSLVSIQALRERGQPRQAQPANTSTGASTGASSLPSDADYVTVVTEALIDAMVSYSMPLELQPDEWFTVAAGDGDAPLMPGMLLRRATVLLRVRGGDITEFTAKRMTIAEIRKRVDVRKF